MYINYLYFICC